MKYNIEPTQHEQFRDWLRDELRRLDFYMRRGDRYLLQPFVAWAAQERGADLDAVSVGRYIRLEHPVLPTPQSCRELARALGRHAIEVLLMAGYLRPDDFYFQAEQGATAEASEAEAEAEQPYAWLPPAVRALVRPATTETRKETGTPAKPSESPHSALQRH